MGILDSIKKNFGLGDSGGEKSGTVLKSPLEGKIIPIEEVPDPVFADKVVGDGVAIDPSGSLIVAPCDGEIGKIFDTNHAFSMETASGVELFVHFGIDTVGLKGEGFKRIATEGQAVKTGDPVIEVDLEFLRKNAKSVITPMVISNMDDVEKLEKSAGPATLCVTDALTVYMK